MPKPSDKGSQKSLRGRPARISPGDIANAALRCGLHDLTMTSLAAELGVRHSALYRHVKDRDAVISLAAAQAIENLDWEKSAADWKSEAILLGQALWNLFSTNSGLAEIIQDPRYQSVAGAASFCGAVDHFVSFGFDEMDAAVFLDSIFDMTADMVSTLERFEQFLEKNETQFADTTASMQDDSRFRVMQRVMELINTDPQAWWQRKMTLLISGAEQIYLSADDR